MVGLSLAFFSFNKGLPLTIRSGFFPLLKDRTWGWFGHVIDIIAVLATIFGLATSLGFGAQQAASGLNFLFGIDSGMGTQVAIIIGMTFVAVISVVRGLEGGAKVLSNLNMGLAALLLIFVFIAGPTLTILIAMGTTASSYFENIIPLSNWIARGDQNSSTVGPCSIGRGGYLDRRSSACSLPAFQRGARYVRSSLPSYLCRRWSRWSG